MSGRLSLLCAAGLALALTGCAGVKPGDLFLLTRTDSATHSTLTMRVNEEGGLHCNGGRELKISDPALVEARGLQEELHEAAAANKYLPPRPGSVFTYKYRDESGTLTFSDNSAGQSGAMHQLQLFVLQTAQQVCGISG